MAFIIPFNMHVPELSPRLAEIVPVWESAAYRPELPDAFCSGPDWQLSCHAVFEPARRLFVKSSADSLLVLAERRYLNGASLLVPLDCGWCFGTTLLGPDSGLLLEETLDEFARVSPGRAPGIMLSGLEGGPGFGRLAKRIGKRGHFHKFSDVIMGTASLAGGLDGYLSRRSPHFRSRARSIRRKAKESGLIFERLKPSSWKDLAPVYERIMKIEAKSWKGLAGCGMNETPSRQYYAALLGRAAMRGAARVVIAKRGGEDIAFIFGSLGGKIYRGQQFSYVREAAAVAPGNVMQLEMIEWLCAEGIERYDPGPCSGPRMQYKCRWVDTMRAIGTWLVVPN